MNYIRHLNSFFDHARQDHNLTSTHVSLYMALFQTWNLNRFQNPFTIQRETIMLLSKIGSKNTYHKCIRDLHLAKYIFYHTQVSKFKHIKISITRLDKIDEKNTAHQLDIFAHKKDDLPCPQNDTASVPDLTATCPENNTVLVPNVGRYYIKQNNKQINSVQKTPSKIFNKNQKISQAINGFIRVADSIVTQNYSPLSFGEPARIAQSDGGLGVRSHPSKQEIASFFTTNNYPSSEAAKFFYYNNSKGWMLTDKIPIKDWQSLAHKWMLNEKDNKPMNEISNHKTSNQKDYSEPL